MYLLLTERIFLQGGELPLLPTTNKVKDMRYFYKDTRKIARIKTFPDNKIYKAY